MLEIGQSILYLELKKSLALKNHQKIAGMFVIHVAAEEIMNGRGRE